VILFKQIMLYKNNFGEWYGVYKLMWTKVCVLNINTHVNIYHCFTLSKLHELNKIFGNAGRNDDMRVNKLT